MVARFNQWPPEDLGGDGSLYGQLLFGDGSQKMLAAMTTWIALLLTWKHHGPEGLKNQFANSMVASFLRIPTTVKATEARGSPLEAVIGRIVSQNIAAKVQPITSFSWASILMQFGSGSFDEALTAYNGHPDVISHDHDNHGSGSIALDSRKKTGVKNWIDRTCPAAFQVVLASTHDYAFNLGPYGEVFANSNQCFLGSKANLEVLARAAEEEPGPNETFIQATCQELFSFTVSGITFYHYQGIRESFLCSMFHGHQKPCPVTSCCQIDWSLPMTAEAQELFFKRVRHRFSRATVGIPVQNKKKYRLTPDELNSLRNVTVLFSQVWPHLTLSCDLCVFVL